MEHAVLTWLNKLPLPQTEKRISVTEADTIPEEKQNQGDMRAKNYDLLLRGTNKLVIIEEEKTTSDSGLNLQGKNLYVYSQSFA